MPQSEQASRQPTYHPMKTIVSIQANLVWHVYQDRASGYFIGVCDPLKITLQGQSLGELTETIDEGINALLHDLIQTNELDLFLRDQGWTLVTPVPKRTENVRFQVPFTIDQRPMHDRQAALR